MIINRVAYQEGTRLVDLPVDDISDYLDKPGCFAMRDPTPQELDAMGRECDLHPLTVEGASHGHQRPKVEEYGDSLFVVMQLIEWIRGDMIFAVATAFAGIWGMNFEFLPELKLRWGYPVALAVIAGDSNFLWWRFRRSGWL